MLLHISFNPADSLRNVAKMKLVELFQGTLEKPPA
jgi:hypothetical protein